jgi:hypothetical protein
MKAYSFYALIFLFLASLITLLIGCEYDVTEPLWDKPPATTAIAVIDSIVPAQAAAGVNIITIYGKNLTGSLDSTFLHTFAGRDTAIVYNGVYFDKSPATIVAASSTSIKVRRPNMTSDSIVVQVTPNLAYMGAKTSPYKIDPVIEKTGKFLTNVELSVIAVDNTENYYVLEKFSGISRTPLYKVTPSGKTLVDTLKALTISPADAKISPLDGLLYMTGQSPLKPFNIIRRVNLATGSVENSWKTGVTTRGVTFFDFDANGNIYAGGYYIPGQGGAGTSSGLVVVTPAGVLTITSYYATTNDVIQAICVYQGYVYVAYKTGAAPVKIARHTVDAGGNVGAPDVILDLSTTGSAFSSKIIRQISFASDGTMYLGTNSTLPDPMLVVTPIGVIPQEVDYFYKNIIPICGKYSACWGTGTILYVIVGNGGSVEYDIYKIDMGVTVGAR